MRLFPRNRRDANQGQSCLPSEIIVTCKVMRLNPLRIDLTIPLLFVMIYLHGYFSKCCVENLRYCGKLFNLSFTAGKVYNTLTGNVRWITVSDIRPISVTHLLSRVAERVIARKCILPAIYLVMIFKTMQFAFRPTGSIVHLLHHVCTVFVGRFQ